MGVKIRRVARSAPIIVVPVLLLSGCSDRPKAMPLARAVVTTSTSTTTSSTTTTSTTVPVTAPPTTQAPIKVKASFNPAPGLYDPFWVALRGCECSNGHCNGKYRGYYQFTYSSWAGAGGSGDPEDASLEEQHARAVYWSQHTNPYNQWPVCWPRAKAETT